MHVVLTGATGLLGRVILDTLVGRRHQVVTIGRTPIGEHFERVDLLDTEQIRRAITNADCIVHAAGKIGDQQAEHSNEGMAEALAMATSDQQLVINLSSVAVYGDVATRVVTEATPCNPVRDYGRSKLRSEQALDQQATHVCHLRIADVYNGARIAKIAASNRQRFVRANEVSNVVFAQDVADVTAYLIKHPLDDVPRTLNVVRPGLGELPFHRIIGPVGYRGLLHRRVPHLVPHLLRRARGFPSLPNKIFTSSAMADLGFEYRPVAEVAPPSWFTLTAASGAEVG